MSQNHNLLIIKNLLITQGLWHSQLLQMEANAAAFTWFGYDSRPTTKPPTAEDLEGKKPLPLYIPELKLRACGGPAPFAGILYNLIYTGGFFPYLSCYHRGQSPSDKGTR